MIRDKSSGKNIYESELIDNLEQIAKRLNTEYLNQREFNANSTKFNSSIYVKRFGSWDKALNTIGLKNGKIQPTVTELIEDLKRVANKINKNHLSYSDYKKKSGKYSIINFKKQLGGWRKAELKAGLIPEKIFTTEVSEEEIVNELKQIAKQNNNILTLKFYKSSAHNYTVSRIINKFGSWNKALRAAGVTQLTKGRIRMDDEFILDDLRAVAAALNKQSISKNDYVNYLGKYSVTSYTGRFGNWNNSIKKAGLTPLKSGSQFKYTDKEMLMDLKKIKQKLNKTKMSYNQYKNNFGKYTFTTIAYRFGGWKNAVILAD